MARRRTTSTVARNEHGQPKYLSRQITAEWFFQKPISSAFLGSIILALTYKHLKCHHSQPFDALNTHFLKSVPFDLSKSTLKTMHNFDHLSYKLT